MGRREGRPLFDLELNLDFDFLAVASSGQAHEPRGVRSRPESWSLLSQPGREAGQGGGEGAARAWASQEHRVSYFSRPANHGRGGGPTWEAGPHLGGGAGRRRWGPRRPRARRWSSLATWAGQVRAGAGRGEEPAVPTSAQPGVARPTDRGAWWRRVIVPGDLVRRDSSLLAAGLKTGGNAKVRRLAWGREAARW